MTQRERVLAAIVAGAVFVLFNLAVVRFFMRENVAQKRELAAAKQKIARNEAREAERVLWEQRNQWLDQNMQPMGDPQQANKQLRDTLVEMGKKHGVTVQQPSWENPKKYPYYTSVSFGIEAKGPWAGIFSFIQELQAPGQFVVFESAKLEVDDKDNTQMKTAFSVAKWYAPEP